MTAKGLMRVSGFLLAWCVSVIVLAQVEARYPLVPTWNNWAWLGMVLVLSVMLAAPVFGIGAAFVARMARPQPQPTRPVQPAANVTAQPAQQARPAQNGRMVYNATAAKMGAMQ